MKIVLVTTNPKSKLPFEEVIITLQEAGFDLTKPTTMQLKSRYDTTIEFTQMEKGDYGLSSSN